MFKLIDYWDLNYSSLNLFIMLVEYADDKKDPDNYVRVNVDIKGLEKALLSKTATNAEITLTRTARYVSLTIYYIQPHLYELWYFNS